MKARFAAEKRNLLRVAFDENTRLSRKAFIDLFASSTQLLSISALRNRVAPVLARFEIEIPKRAGTTKNRRPKKKRVRFLAGEITTPIKRYETEEQFLKLRPRMCGCTSPGLENFKPRLVPELGVTSETTQDHEAPITSGRSCTKHDREPACSESGQESGSVGEEGKSECALFSPTSKERSAKKTPVQWASIANAGEEEEEDEGYASGSSTRFKTLSKSVRDRMKSFDAMKWQPTEERKKHLL